MEVTKNEGNKTPTGNCEVIRGWEMVLYKHDGNGTMMY